MIAIVRYNAGNVASVVNALHRLGQPCVVTDDPAALQAAEKVIFPGVGAAGPAMQYLRERQLDIVLAGLRQPVLGICLGLQLLCRHSEEDDTPCLGIFDAEVRKFPAGAPVPHMGWNNLYDGSGPLLAGLTEAEDLYFVHSFYATTGPHTAARCDYLLPFSAVLQKENFFATQFHPEKSAGAGVKILKNFLAL